MYSVNDYARLGVLFFNVGKELKAMRRYFLLKNTDNDIQSWMAAKIWFITDRMPVSVVYELKILASLDPLDTLVNKGVQVFEEFVYHTLGTPFGVLPQNTQVMIDNTHKELRLAVQKALEGIQPQIVCTDTEVRISKVKQGNEITTIFTLIPGDNPFAVLETEGQGCFPTLYPGTDAVVMQSILAEHVEECLS